MQFSAQPVLRGLSVGVARGQTLAVIGESGCGKTVLLKIMIGLLRPTTGRVIFDGKEWSNLSRNAAIPASSGSGSAICFKGRQLVRQPDRL